MGVGWLASKVPDQLHFPQDVMWYSLNLIYDCVIPKVLFIMIFGIFAGVFYIHLG